MQTAMTREETVIMTARMVSKGMCPLHDQHTDPDRECGILYIIRAIQRAALAQALAICMDRVKSRGKTPEDAVRIDEAMGCAESIMQIMEYEEPTT